MTENSLGTIDKGREGHSTGSGEGLRRCCQSNRNSSPIGGAQSLRAEAQAMSDCHSASAAERRSL